MMPSKVQLKALSVLFGGTAYDLDDGRIGFTIERYDTAITGRQILDVCAILEVVPEHVFWNFEQGAVYYIGDIPTINLVREVRR